MNKNKFIVNFVLGFTKITGFLPAMLFLKPKIYLKKGAKRRLTAPCILVSNHCSLIDFVLYLMVFPFRTIRFLMAEVLFNKGKFFSSFLYALGGIFVDREAKDFEFVSNSIEVLEKGGIVGSFPQGRLPVKGKSFPFTASTAFIATHANAPIVPVFTDGNYGIFKRTRVVIGEAFYLTDYALDTLDENEQLTHLTQILEKKVFELKNEIKTKQTNS